MKTITNIPDEWNNISALFIALGDEQRQRILLSFEKNERLNIIQIVANSKLGRTAVTHHLKVLHNSGALQSEKVGKEVFFWLDKRIISENIQAVLKYIQEEI
ncbi:MAG: ArsR/SmtB family transcription factor [Methylophilaceae bacterium]